MSDHERWKSLGRGKRVARKSSLPLSTKVNVRHLNPEDIEMWRQMAALAGLSSVVELIYHAMRHLMANPAWKKMMIDSVNNFRALVHSDLTKALVSERGALKHVTPELAVEYLERTGRVVWGEREVRLLKLIRRSTSLEALASYQLSKEDLLILKRWSGLGLWVVDDPSGFSKLRLTAYGRRIVAAALGETESVDLEELREPEQTTGRD